MNDDITLGKPHKQQDEQENNMVMTERAIYKSELEKQQVEADFECQK